MAESMARLHVQCFATPRPWRAAEFAELLARPEVIAIRNDAGFALGRIVADEMEVLTLAVHPDARQRGLGGRLLAALLRDGHAHGAREVFLEVAADNSAARALYARARFAMAGCRPGYYRMQCGAEVDALVLRRELAEPPVRHVTG